MDNKKLDIMGGVVFAGLTVGFLLLMVFNQGFFDWAWGRHHNILSWYVRPLTMLPFIYFAYKHSVTGMAFSVFVLATSMAWFPEPATASPLVLEFLAMEVEYMSSAWTVGKILLTLTVPIWFTLLSIAFWQRSLFYGGLVVIAAAVGKMVWGVVEAGQSGWAMLPPAGLGLVLTLALLYFSSRWQERKAQQQQQA